MFDDQIDNPYPKRPLEENLGRWLVIIAVAVVAFVAGGLFS